MAFEILITNNASTTDTIREIIKLVNEQSKQDFVIKLAQALRPEGSKLEYIRRLFDFVCKNVEYEMDPLGWEKLYTPGKLFIEAKGDCKKMTTAISSVLKDAGIEPLLKVISYDDKNWEHIYVLAKINNTYYTLDPVNNKIFNEEIPHAKAEVFNLLGNSVPMSGTKLSILGSTPGDWFKPLERGVGMVANDLDAVSAVAGRYTGIGCDCGTIKGSCQEEIQCLSGIGGSNQYFEYTTGEAVKHAAARVAPPTVAMRAAFLGLLYLGKLLAKIAGIRIYLPHRIAFLWNENPNKMRKWWWEWGGEADASALRTALIKVVGGTIAGPSDRLFYGAGYDYPLSIDPLTVFPGQMPRTVQRAGVSGIGEAVTLATATAAAAVAAPIIISIISLLKKEKKLKDGETDPEPTTAEEAAVPQIPPPQPPGGGPPKEDDNASVTGIALGFMFDQMPLYISLPVIAYTLFHYRNVWTKYIPFVK